LEELWSLSPEQQTIFTHINLDLLLLSLFKSKSPTSLGKSFKIKSAASAMALQFQDQTTFNSHHPHRAVLQVLQVQEQVQPEQAPPAQPEQVPPAQLEQVQPEQAQLEKAPQAQLEQAQLEQAQLEQAQPAEQALLVLHRLVQVELLTPLLGVHLATIICNSNPHQILVKYLLIVVSEKPRQLRILGDLLFTL
jgi:flagellar biosynthesis GTPase FlhF